MEVSSNGDFGLLSLLCHLLLSSSLWYLKATITTNGVFPNKQLIRGWFSPRIEHTMRHKYAAFVSFYMILWHDALMLIDDVIIQVTAGHGGNGAVAFNNVPMSLGPTGADGGTGGSVYFEGVSSLDALLQFSYLKEHNAENGENGKKQFRDGAAGKDLILRIPVGTVITNVDTGDVHEITQVGQRMQAARGGIGGRGNFKFRSSRNTTPYEFEEGKPGDTFSFRLELKLIADVGFVGLPNAGKSSLLNTLTGAHTKVANYPFTTLEPALGAYHDLILADIPGLIEGAAGGKGLGTKFLRHIERTKILFHLVSAESEDPIHDYNVVRKELDEYSDVLAEKKEYVFLSKSDSVSSEELKGKIKTLKDAKISADPISIIDESEWQSVTKALKEVLDKKVV